MERLAGAIANAPSHEIPAVQNLRRRLPLGPRDVRRLMTNFLSLGAHRSNKTGVDLWPRNICPGESSREQLVGAVAPIDQQAEPA